MSSITPSRIGSINTMDANINIAEWKHVGSPMTAFTSNLTGNLVLSIVTGHIHTLVYAYSTELPNYKHDVYSFIRTELKQYAEISQHW